MENQYIPNFSMELFDDTDETELITENAQTLLAFQQEIEAGQQRWAVRKIKLNSILEKKYSVRAANLRNKDSGVIHLQEDDGTIVTANARKEVKWDQEKMVAVRERIIKAVDYPDNYMKAVYEIPEKQWNGWGIGSWQQKAFIDARTVKIRETFVIVDNDQHKEDK